MSFCGFDSPVPIQQTSLPRRRNAGPLFEVLPRHLNRGGTLSLRRTRHRTPPLPGPTLQPPPKASCCISTTCIPARILDIVYRVGDTYLPGALAKLNYFLRDHRTNDVSHYDVKEFDLLHSVMGKLGKPNDVIDVVCGYRTPWSNNFLRSQAAVTGVAKNSQHTQAKAIDIRVPGVGTRELRDVAQSLHGGGVGLLPNFAIRSC